jgi:hypothetical protein
MSALRSMTERYGRPDWVRRINAMADSLGAPLEGARRLVSLEPGDLIETAQRSLGLTQPADFGDPQWRARVEVLCRGADAAPLTVVGRLMTRQEILRGLRTRFLLGEALAREPRIAQERIAAPVIVTGPARSGTSILFELLWLDPALRGPAASEVLHPFPLPEHGGEDRRLAITECEQEFWADVAPEFAAIHELRSDLPVECVTLTLPSFCGWHWPMVLQMPGWTPDIGENYQFHRRILQVLQHGREQRSWLLKTRRLAPARHDRTRSHARELAHPKSRLGQRRQSAGIHRDADAPARGAQPARTADAPHGHGYGRSEARVSRRGLGLPRVLATSRQLDQLAC